MPTFVIWLIVFVVLGYSMVIGRGIEYERRRLDALDKPKPEPEPSWPTPEVIMPDLSKAPKEPLHEEGPFR